MAARKHTASDSYQQLVFEFPDPEPPVARGFERICPSCGSLVVHTMEGNRNKAEKLGKICRKCDYARRSVAYTGAANPFYGKKHTEETIAKFRAREHPHVKEEWFKRLRSKQMKENNPIDGTNVYEIWVRKFGKEKADEMMAAWREKISRASFGANHHRYGKPPPQGSGNGWSGWYKGWFFRSLRELAYMVGTIERQGLQWRSAETADLRISYTDWNGTSRTYTADFLIGGKVLVEIKPLRLHTSKTVVLKRDAALAFCQERGLEYRIEDSTPLSNAAIAVLRDSGTLTFTERYEAKYKEYINKCV